MYIYYAPVICMPRHLGTGDTRDIAGPKCRDLTFDLSPQCRRCVKVFISRLNRPLRSLWYIFMGAVSTTNMNLIYRATTERYAGKIRQENPQIKPSD